MDIFFRIWPPQPTSILVRGRAVHVTSKSYSIDTLLYIMQDQVQYIVATREIPQRDGFNHHHQDYSPI